MTEKKYNVEYPFIRAWGKMLGSFDYYVEDMVKKAKEDNAPITVIYCNENKKTEASGNNRDWKTVDTCRSDIKIQLYKYVKDNYEIKPTKK